MNGAQIHLIFNHFPIIGTIIGLLVLITGLLIKRSEVKKTALGIIVFSSLLAIPTFLSGEEAEEVIEEQTNISHDIIEEHEELAESFIWMTSGLGLISLIALFAYAKNWGSANMLTYFTLIAALVIIFYAQKVGTSGGEINHPEIREGVAPSPSEHESSGKYDDD